MTSHSTLAIWGTLAAIGIGTFLTRFSFLAALARVDAIPPLVTRILRLIPAAVIAAIAVPALTHATGTFDLATDRFFAGTVAAFVAWRTRNVVATIAVGMGLLWAVDALGWFGG
ncbi:MAG: AzlD domain-containing protein [Acidimicrobiia bacterium]